MQRTLFSPPPAVGRQSGTLTNQTNPADRRAPPKVEGDASPILDLGASTSTSSPSTPATDDGMSNALRELQTVSFAAASSSRNDQHSVVRIEVGDAKER